MTSFHFITVYVVDYFNIADIYFVAYAGMTVLYAYYGLSCANGDVRKSYQDRTTRYAKNLCDGKNSCSGYIHTSIITDPYYGCRKGEA